MRTTHHAHFFGAKTVVDLADNFKGDKYHEKAYCHACLAVQVEPGLQPESPKNGSFPNIRRRLSAISLGECPKSESGDRRLSRKSPPLAGLSANITGDFSDRGTA